MNCLLNTTLATYHPLVVSLLSIIPFCLSSLHINPEYIPKMCPYLDPPPSPTDLFTQYLSLISDARVHLPELVQQSYYLYYEFYIAYPRMERDIVSLREAIERYPGVVIGFVRMMQIGQGKAEWVEVVEREIMILEYAMELGV